MQLQALVFLLALMVRAANRPAEYDSDDEYIASRQQIQRPLLSRPPPPSQSAAGVPGAGALDQRTSRNDAWSTRMREKVGPFMLYEITNTVGPNFFCLVQKLCLEYSNEGNGGFSYIVLDYKYCWPKFLLYGTRKKEDHMLYA